MVFVCRVRSYVCALNVHRKQSNKFVDKKIIFIKYKIHIFFVCSVQSVYDVMSPFACIVPCMLYAAITGISKRSKQQDTRSNPNSREQENGIIKFSFFLLFSFRSIFLLKLTFIIDWMLSSFCSGISSLCTVSLCVCVSHRNGCRCQHHHPFNDGQCVNVEFASVFVRSPSRHIAPSIAFLFHLIVSPLAWIMHTHIHIE